MWIAYRGTHPSANPGGTANQEDAAPVLSNHELAHNSLKNLNNGSTTTNPQTKHTQINSTPAPAHRASQPILKPMPRYVRLVVPPPHHDSRAAVVESGGSPGIIWSG